MDLGTGQPYGVAPTSITSWSPAKPFNPGSVILNPLNGHYYAATVGGLSGGTMPALPVSAWLSVSEAAAVVSWREIGPNAPSGAQVVLWTSNTFFPAAQVINGLNKHYYTAGTAGLSGAALPNFTRAP